MITLRQQQFNVKRDDLINAIKKCKADHVAAYAEAKADYEAALLAEFTRIRDQIAAGNFKDVSLHLPAPQDHTADYTDILEGLEFSSDETFLLDKDAYKAYVKNEWSWSHHFAESASMYKATIAAAAVR